MNDTQTLAATPMTDALACVTTDNAVNDRLATLDLCRQLERDLIELRGWFTARMDQVETDLAIARDGCDRWRAAYTAARADRAALSSANASLVAALQDAITRAAEYGMVDLPQDLAAVLAKVQS